MFCVLVCVLLVGELPLPPRDNSCREGFHRSEFICRVSRLTEMQSAEYLALAHLVLEGGFVESRKGEMKNARRRNSAGVFHSK